MFLLFSLLSFPADPVEPWVYILISILATLTLVGSIYICRKVPEIREKCCYSSVNIEKEDENPDYGEYRLV